MVTYGLGAGVLGVPVLVHIDEDVCADVLYCRCTTTGV